jgi:RNA polymerase sigma-70 factor, ECF subfamily
MNDVMDASPAPDQGASLLSLYDEALPAVYGYLRRRVSSDSIAQDLTSETFLAAVASIRATTASQVSVAWLMGIARHKLLDHFRRVSRDDRNLQAVAAVVASQDAEDRWQVTLRDDVISAALDDLRLHHRCALTLRHLDGLSVPEVAQILGRTIHATEALLVRARASFRVSYEIQQQRFSHD